MSRCAQGVSPTNCCRNTAPAVLPASRPRPEILDVGDVGLDVLLVRLAQRQAPEQLAACGGGGGQVGGQRLVVAEQAGLLVAQRHDHRAGERGEVDHRLGLEPLARVVEHVAQDEPALGVGVDDLDRLAGHAADHVARAAARWPRACFRPARPRPPRWRAPCGRPAPAWRRTRRRHRPCRPSSPPCPVPA